MHYEVSRTKLKLRRYVNIALLFVFMTVSIGLIICGFVMTFFKLHPCPDYPTGLLLPGWLMAVTGIIGLILFTTSLIAIIKFPLLTCITYGVLGFLCFCCLSWSTLKFKEFHETRDIYEKKLPQYFEHAKPEFMKYWHEAHKKQDLHAMEYWRNIESLGRCCGYYGYDDWLKFNGSVTAECICEKVKNDDKYEYPDNCEFEYIPLFREYKAIRSVGCKGEFSNQLNNSMLALLIMSAIGFIISVIFFGIDLFLLLRKGSITYNRPSDMQGVELF